MSAAEEVIKPESLSVARHTPILNRILDLLSSVRFGIVLLCSLVVLSVIGMVVVQQNVQPDFGAYYASLTPAEKLVYGRLDIFDIYHSWYFNLLLLVLSLNIVLASIDRFPSAWQYIVRPKLDASRAWLLGRRRNIVISSAGDDPQAIAASVAGIFRSQRLSTTVTAKHDVIYVLGQSGKWNRLGAYMVHVALLTLFLGHFVSLQTGFGGLAAQVRLAPGDSTNQIQLIDFDLDKTETFDAQVPFTIECTDIEQQLINPEGGIDVTNTMDWHTRMRITDPGYGDNTYDVSLNRPLSYRGYRFFQAQAISMGSARQIRLDLTPQNGGEAFSVNIPRGGSTILADGTRISFDQFLPDFTFNKNGQPDTGSGDYLNPAAVLSVVPPGGAKTRVFAFAGKTAENIPVGAPKAGYKWRLGDFEK